MKNEEKEKKAYSVITKKHVGFFNLKKIFDYSLCMLAYYKKKELYLHFSILMSVTVFN